MHKPLASFLASCSSAAEFRDFLLCQVDGATLSKSFLFLDAEFIPGPQMKLLSVGLVGSAQLQYYAELPDHLNSSCTPFIEEMVAPQMGLLDNSAFLSTQQLADDLFRWLARIKAPHTCVVVDSPLDAQAYELLAQAARGAGARTRPPVLCVGALFDEPEFDDVKEAAWNQAFAHKGIHRHHALADALALQAAVRQVLEEAMPGTRR